MGDAWKTAMDLRYKVKKLKLVVEWEDGDVAVVEGEHLIADIKVTPASVPDISIETQDMPYVLLPMHNEKLTLEFTSQTRPSRLELFKGGPQHFDHSTRWLHQ